MEVVKYPISICGLQETDVKYPKRPPPPFFEDSIKFAYLTRTNGAFDIILPTTSFGEKEGTFTNLEMRTLKQNKILPTPGSVLNESEYWSMILNKIDIENNYESEFELNLQLCEEYLDKDNVPSFDNLNKPSNLDGVLNSKPINIEIYENLCLFFNQPFVIK